MPAVSRFKETQEEGTGWQVMLGRHTACMSPPSRILSLQPQGAGDGGLCGLEKYHLTHPRGEGWTLYSATSQHLALFNAFNTFQMVKLL